MSGIRSRLSRRSWPVWALLATLALLALPWLAPASAFGSTEMALVVRIMALALFATSANILLGYSGMLTLGHSAFYGVGAYVLVLGLDGALPLPLGGYFPSALASVVVVVLLAAVMGGISVQKGDFSFALLTLAFSMLIYRLAIEWRGVTGGSDGMIVPDATVPLGVASFQVRDALPYYLFAIVVVVLCLLALWYVTKTPLGELFLAIRENEERARFVGIRVTYVKWVAFIVGGLFAGVAGMLIAPLNFVVSPSQLHWLKSADPILVILIGGPSVFVGPTVGAFVFMGLEVVLTTWISEWRIALGVVLILMVIYMPGGAAGFFVDRETTVRDRLAALPRKLREYL